MKRGGPLSILVGTISNVLGMEIGWTDVGSGVYILVFLGLSTYCLQFYYHMWGIPGTLMVNLGERSSQGSTVWSVSGSQGQQWKYQQVEIDATTVNDPVVTFFFNLIIILENYREICLIRHTEGSGKCVGCWMSPLLCTR